MFVDLSKDIAEVIDRVKSLGAVVESKIEEPASDENIDFITYRVGLNCDHKIPDDMISLFRTFSRKASFFWSIDQNRITNPKLKEWGDLQGHFKIDYKTVNFINYEDFAWAEEIVSGEEEGVWLSQMRLSSECDGDFISIALEGELKGKPLYYNHYGMPPKPLVLGDNLNSFFEMWKYTGYCSINDFCDIDGDYEEEAFETEHLKLVRSYLGIEKS